MMHGHKSLKFKKSLWKIFQEVINVISKTGTKETTQAVTGCTQGNGDAGQHWE